MAKGGNVESSVDLVEDLRRKLEQFFMEQYIEESRQLLAKSASD